MPPIRRGATPPPQNNDLSVETVQTKYPHLDAEQIKRMLEYNFNADNIEYVAQLKNKLIINARIDGIARAKEEEKLKAPTVVEKPKTGQNGYDYNAPQIKKIDELFQDYFGTSVRDYIDPVVSLGTKKIFIDIVKFDKYLIETLGRKYRPNKSMSDIILEHYGGDAYNFFTLICNL